VARKVFDHVGELLVVCGVTDRVAPLLPAQYRPVPA
jgi:hypothetical protein